MEEVTLQADAGRPSGTRPARRLRREGKIPAVLYGHGLDAISLAVDGRELRNALGTEAGVNALITLQVDGARHLAMARQLQRHPVRGTVDHVDFVVVRRDEVITTEVPVHLVGDAEEVRRGDGMVEQAIFALTIQALPGDIPPALELDISALTIGDTIRVKDLALPRGVSTEIDAEEPVVVGQPPRVTVEEEEAAEAAAEAEGVPPEEAAEEAPEAGAEPATVAESGDERGGE